MRRFPKTGGQRGAEIGAMVGKQLSAPSQTGARFATSCGRGSRPTHRARDATCSSGFRLPSGRYPDGLIRNVQRRLKDLARRDRVRPGVRRLATSRDGSAFGSNGVRQRPISSGAILVEAIRAVILIVALHFYRLYDVLASKQERHSPAREPYEGLQDAARN